MFGVHVCMCVPVASLAMCRCSGKLAITLNAHSARFQLNCAQARLYKHGWAWYRAITRAILGWNVLKHGTDPRYTLIMHLYIAVRKMLCDNVKRNPHHICLSSDCSGVAEESFQWEAHCWSACPCWWCWAAVILHFRPVSPLWQKAPVWVESVKSHVGAIGDALIAKGKRNSHV